MGCSSRLGVKCRVEYPAALEKQTYVTMLGYYHKLSLGHGLMD